MTRHRRIIDASLRRHLSAVYRTERLSGAMGQLVKAALRAALAHLPDKPHPSNMAPAVARVRDVADRLRIIAGFALAGRLKDLAEWGHLAMGRVLTTRARDAVNTERKEPVLEDGFFKWDRWSSVIPRQGGLRGTPEGGVSSEDSSAVNCRARCWQDDPIANPRNDILLREDLSDYLKLIIDPPGFDLLRLIVGEAPDLLTRLIDPQAASNAVLQGISLGWDRRRIAAELTDTFGGWEIAARRIARTEGLRVSTQTQLSASEEIPELISGYQVLSVLDARVRPEHRERHGTIYHRVPKGSQLGFDVMPQPPTDQPGNVLAHNCRCVTGDTRIHGAIQSISRAWYEGQGVELRTRHGARLTVTANHPVATDKGFVPAHALRKGDYVLSDGIRSRQFADNVDDGAPTIEEEFQSALVLGNRGFLQRPNALEFHGDGAFMKGYVRVVFADGELMNRRGAECGQSNDQFAFGRGTLGTVSRQSLIGLSLGRHPGPLQRLGYGSSANWHTGFNENASQSVGLSAFERTPRNAVEVGERFEGLAGLVAFDETRRGRHAISRPTNSTRFRFCAELDPVLDKVSADDRIAGGEFILKLMNRHPAEIHFDELVGVNHFSLASHVYSVDTGLGYYTGTGNKVSIVQGNCMLVPVFHMDEANAEDVRGMLADAA